MLGAERGHPDLGPAVDKGVLNLIRDHPEAMIADDPQPLGVEIGQPEMADLARLLQIGEMVERVEIALIGIIPPMKLQQVEALHAHARQRDADRVFDYASRHAGRPWHPFRKGLDLREPRLAVTRDEQPAEGADEILGWAVMIGKVPGREAGVVMGEHRFDGARRIDRTMSAGDLPHPVQYPADAEIRSKLVSARCGQRHLRPPGSELALADPEYIGVRGILDV